MKILKKLSVLVAVVAMFGTTALAADFNLSATEYAAGDETVSVSLYADDAVDYLGGGSSICVDYDSDVFEYVDATANFGTEFSDFGTYVTWAETTFMTNYTIPADNKVIFTMNFKVKEGKDPVGKTFKTSQNALLNSSWGLYDAEGASVVVKGAAPASNVSADIDSNGVITVAGDSAIAGKKLVVSETTCSTVTENTRVKVTLGDDYKIFGENMWKECQIEGPGLLQSKTVAFGVIFTGDYAASDFDFEIIPDITTYNAN